MAQPVTKKQIRQIPCTPYEAVRDELRTGDLVFCSGSYLFSRLIQRFTRDQLAVTPLCFDNSFFCKICQGMASSKTCSHPAGERISLSGTAVREMLAQGKAPPAEFTRPEIAEILKEAYAGPAGARI